MSTYPSNRRTGLHAGLLALAAGLSWVAVPASARARRIAARIAPIDSKEDPC